MTKQKLKLLRSLLDELEEERQEFARDAGIEVDDEEFARLAGRYLGKPLPRLGETRDEQDAKPRRSRAHDAAEDAAANFERNCRTLRLKLQAENTK
jgi:hypothetical protein